MVSQDRATGVLLSSVRHFLCSKGKEQTLCDVFAPVGSHLLSPAVLSLYLVNVNEQIELNWLQIALKSLGFK